MPLLTSCPEPLEPVVAGLRTWQLREPQPKQGDPALDVWLLAWPSEPSKSDRQAWWDLLDEPERARCSRIGTGAGQIRFAASHAAARSLVPEPQTWCEGRASLSHTAALAAVACADVRVGIDVEADVPRPRWSAADRQQWPDSPAGSWSEFVERWVMHEATFKAGPGNGVGTTLLNRIQELGRGLTDHILAVVLNPGDRVREDR